MEVKKLRFKYPKAKKYVLKDVSFKCKKGKLNVIAGLNGSGKTTLFDCITRVLTPESGSIDFLDTKEILYLTQTIYFSLVIKGKDLAKYISVLNDEPLDYKSEDFRGQLTDREKERFEHLMDLKIGKMSVGERRWLFITLLSAIDRSVYIFDEPVSGVDPSSRRRIFARINRLIADGKLCLISTHQLQDLTHVDCHFILLHNGTILYEGDFQEWLKTHQSNDPDEVFERMTSGMGADV